MKNARQNAIVEIIESSDIETQEELIRQLSAKGFNVTQATVSRDIRELKLIKVTGELGKYKYIVSQNSGDDGQQVYLSAFAQSVKSVDTAMNIVVIKTYPGMASAVAANLDTQNDFNIVGCVAGDDTIFAAARSAESALAVAEKIRASLHAY